jgi:hypothetical protein
MLSTATVSHASALSTGPAPVASVSSILCVPSGVSVTGAQDVTAFERVFTAQTNALLQEPIQVGLNFKRIL